MPPSAFTPTVAQVGTLLRARTNDAGGNEIGTFDETTRPDGEQVKDLIDAAVSKVVGKVGEELPDELLDSAREVAALRAAMLIEMSYFPEQVDSTQSAFPRLKELYNEGLADLYAAFMRISKDGKMGTEDDWVAGRPSYGFPADHGGLVGWQTVM